MTGPAAKGRKLFSLVAAIVAAAATLLAPAPAGASRYLPSASNPTVAPQPSLEALVAGDADCQPAFPLLTATDRRQLAATLAGELAPATRFSLLSDLAPGSGELAAWKLASGSSAWGIDHNVWAFREIATETRWRADLYQAFGFDALNVTDPFGECANLFDPECRERWKAGVKVGAKAAVEYVGRALWGAYQEPQDVGADLGEAVRATVQDPSLPAEAFQGAVRDVLETALRVAIEDPEALLADAANSTQEVLADPDRTGRTLFHGALMVSGGWFERPLVQAGRTVGRFTEAAGDLGDAGRALRGGSEVPESAATHGWQSGLKTRPNPASTRKLRFQEKYAGPVEYRIEGGGQGFWADGLSQNTVLETKLIVDPARSPFIPGSQIPPNVRSVILDQVHDEFRRMSAIIADPANPLKRVLVSTNDLAAARYLQKMMRQHKLPGFVRVVAE